MQLDPDEISRVYRKYSVDRLMIGYYQKQGGEDLGSDIDFDYVERRQEYNEKRKKDKDIQEWVSDEEKFLEEKMVEMLTLDFTNPENELVNFVQYGTIIAEVLKNLKNELPEVWMVLSSGCDCEGECDGSCGSGKGGEDEDDGEGMGSILRKLIRGVLVDAPDLKDFSDEQIEDGLDKIIREWGKQRYEKIREFVEKELGKKFDQPPEERKQQKGIGLSSSSLQLYDEQIPYYKRLSRTYGLYIHRKPMIVDVTESFPQGSEKFRVGDKVRRMNPFSTGGRIYPGLTKKYKEKSGTKKDRQYKIPDLFIWLDSSGSMEHPNSGSKAITASFVLARNYWENGAKVGVANFSCDTAFLFPTRDLDLAYSMLCAYWGGGTVLNVDKIKEYVEKMAKGGPAGMPQMPYYTTEQDYEHLVARMPEQQQKEFLDKKMEVDVSKKVQDTYEKMDNVLITDGGIWNLEEVIGYLNGLAELTRNTVFLIDSWGQGEEWSQKSLPYTQIITVSKPEDLLGLSIGEAKKIVPDQEKPASLFYQ